ncbi:MAG: DUF2177 family protein [Cytophagales bacterium]|nr:DUF2177 family protein [Cytophagales bacterium]MCA6366033.1 DUF2177 family protein [Cytophagales bacterium]MCA6373125.1 DUF2177 family protein [Cytophagales bacterium]MCA6376002.1 DUF2177 family protein [Cytophagales bacterium]MCA6383453.1 DUF2177 family protein [Cytophagales bacterium]
MRLFLKLYLIALPIFFMVDMIWLGVLAKNFYKNQIGFLMKPDVNWAAAIIFYLLFLVGIVLFVIEPALEKKDLMFAFSRGALFGLITYATYDLTNLATLKNWPLKVVVVDMIWGAVLSGTVCGSSYWIANKLGL